MNYIKATNITPEEKRFYEYQRKICSWTNIRKILLEIQKLPSDIKSIIRIKDSIRNHKEYHTLTSDPRTSECDITRCGDTGEKDLKGRSGTISPSRQTNNKEVDLN